MGVTHSDLVHAAHRWLRGARSTLVLTEFASTMNAEFPDAIGWGINGVSTLVECKVSRADFKADAKKTCRIHPEMGMGYYRWFLTPPGLIDSSEVPAGWGHAELRGARVFKRSKPTPFLAYDWRAEMRVMVSAVRRLQDGYGLRVFSPDVTHPLLIDSDGVWFADQPIVPQKETVAGLGDGRCLVTACAHTMAGPTVEFTSECPRCCGTGVAGAPGYEHTCETCCGSGSYISGGSVTCSKCGVSAMDVAMMGPDSPTAGRPAVEGHNGVNDLESD